jgi:hypothetical protein
MPKTRYLRVYLGQSVTDDLITGHMVSGVKLAELVPIYRERQHRLLYGTREVAIVLLTEQGRRHGGIP